MEDAGGIVLLIVVFALVVLMVSLIVYFPINVAKKNGHPNPSAIGGLAVIGLFLWPCWIAAVIWAYVGGKPKQQASAVTGKPPAPARPQAFDVLAKDANGKQVRTRIEAVDENDARFVAADRGLEVVAVRAATSPPEWIVTGKDNRGGEHRLKVNGATREDAFMAATMNGIVQAHSIERA